MVPNKLLPAVFLLVFTSFFAPGLRAQHVEHGTSGKSSEPSTEQPVKEKEQVEEKTGFKSRLWYGGGIQLGFSSYYNANIFAFGLSPMVGYKFSRFFSLGPRLEVVYNSYKIPGYKAFSLFDTDLGMFARFRVFRGLFFQGELASEWYDNLDANLEKYRTQRFNQRLGAGWNWSDGHVGSEIGVFYNFAVANDLNAYQNPLSYRFGFTWNF